MGFFTKKKQTLSFPFDDQQNTACIVCCHILEGHPILYERQMNMTVCGNFYVEAIII